MQHLRSATGMPVADARGDFARARRAALVGRAARWLDRRSRPRVPRTLDRDDWLPYGAPELRVIPLDEIVGTVEPTISFDAEFRPLTELVRARWERIALAHHRGVALPPIDVLKRPDGYYVVDGRHRVSVARTLGHRDIDAWVTTVGNPRVSRRTPRGAAVRPPRTAQGAARGFDARPTTRTEP